MTSAYITGVRLPLYGASPWSMVCDARILRYARKSVVAGRGDASESVASARVLARTSAFGAFLFSMHPWVHGFFDMYARRLRSRPSLHEVGHRGTKVIGGSAVGSDGLRAPCPVICRKAGAHCMRPARRPHERRHEARKLGWWGMAVGRRCVVP